MSELYPQITFQVNNINYQDMFQYPLPDDFENIIKLLKVATIWVTHVPYELRYGDCFTLYGPDALDVYRNYIVDVEDIKRILEVKYYGVPSTLCFCNCNLTLSPDTLPDFTVGVAYSETIVPLGSAGPFTFSIDSGALPTGLSLNSTTGVISGTPSATGVFTFKIKCTDGGAEAFKEYTVTINPAVSITTASLPDDTQNTPYSATVVATGGTGTKIFSDTSGSLPTGLSLDASTGVISGASTAAATYNFTITCTDSVGSSDKSDDLFVY